MMDLTNQTLAFRGRKCGTLRQKEIFREPRNLSFDAVRRQRVELGQIHARDDRAMQAGLHFLERLVPVDSLFYCRARAVTVLVFDVSFSKRHFVPFDSFLVDVQLETFRSRSGRWTHVLAMLAASSSVAGPLWRLNIPRKDFFRG